MLLVCPFSRYGRSAQKLFISKINICLITEVDLNKASLMFTSMNYASPNLKRWRHHCPCQCQSPLQVHVCLVVVFTSNFLVPTILLMHAREPDTDLDVVQKFLKVLWLFSNLTVFVSLWSDLPLNNASAVWDLSKDIQALEGTQKLFCYRVPLKEWRLMTSYSIGVPPFVN